MVYAATIANAAAVYSLLAPPYCYQIPPYFPAHHAMPASYDALRPAMLTLLMLLIFFSRRCRHSSPSRRLIRFSPALHNVVSPYVSSAGERHVWNCCLLLAAYDAIPCRPPATPTRIKRYSPYRMSPPHYYDIRLIESSLSRADASHASRQQAASADAVIAMPSRRENA